MPQITKDEFRNITLWAPDGGDAWHVADIVDVNKMDATKIADVPGISRSGVCSSLASQSMVTKIFWHAYGFGLPTNCTWFRRKARFFGVILLVELDAKSYDLTGRGWPYNVCQLTVVRLAKETYCWWVESDPDGQNAIRNLPLPRQHEA